VIVGLSILTGCATPPVPPHTPVLVYATPPGPSSLLPVAHSDPPITAVEFPFAGTTELTEAALVSTVLTRNPTVAQMTATWQAAVARYPQVTSFDDPRVGGFVGPGSFGSSSVDFAYRIEISQAIPFPGKREFRGQTVLNEAAAAGAEVEDAKLVLTEAARSAFADYFLAVRAIEVAEENLRLLNQFRENALARFRATQGSIQDSQQAEVAIARQRERLVTLDRQRKVAIARLNTLMHLPPDHPLPPPPKALDRPAPLPPVAVLREQAARRPDVQAAKRRVAAEEAAVELAQREYKPDFEVMAAYDTWWQSPEKALRPMIGVRANLPLRLSRRDGAVAEAQFRLAQRRAELARLIDRVHFEVQAAYEEVTETERVFNLFTETALPAARRNVESAVAEYTVNKVPFLNLIDAQRSLVELKDRYNEAAADLHRRRVALDRAVGGSATTDVTPPKSASPGT
jgi:outer membrane protein TolC